MATKKKATKSAPRWQAGVVHPVTKKPVGGKAMSKRDQRLFKTTGKRRKSVGSAKIADAYGKAPKKAVKKVVKKKAVKKTVKKAVKKVAKKAAKKTVKRMVKKTTAKKPPKGAIRVRVPAQAARYVIVDGRNHFVSSSKTISNARSKVKALMATNKAKAYKIIDTK
jgi:hypothetical protein